MAKKPVTPETDVVTLMKNLEESLARAKLPPVRQRSARGEPKPKTSIERRCARCGASFIELAAGKTGERGLWKDWQWFCSQECHDEKRTLR